ncbi:hypothetical protein NKH77_51765 [Streptomyces sp. M19]
MYGRDGGAVALHRPPHRPVRPTAAPGVGFTAFALSALAQTQLTADTSLLYLAGALALMGIGWACVLSPATVSALSAVPERQAGLAVGSSWTFHNLGGAVGLAASVVLFRSFATDSLTDALARRQQPTGDWVDTAIADPEAATTLLTRKPLSPRRTWTTCSARSSATAYKPPCGS